MRTSVCVVLLWVAGCSVSPSVDGGVELPPVQDAGVADAGVSDAGVPDAGSPVAAWDSQLAGAFCAKIFGCCSTTEIEANFGEVTDEAACRALWLTRFSQRRVFFETSISEGRMRFVPEKGTECIAALSALACGDFNRWFGPPACSQVYVGTVADGDPCVLTEDCRAVNSSCLEVSGQKQCVAAIGAGQPCGEEFGRCLPGTRCVGNSTTGRPVCVQELPLGSACVVGSQCASQTCDDTGTCAPTPRYCGG
jgi:hypothetical protein